MSEAESRTPTRQRIVTGRLYRVRSGRGYRFTSQEPQPPPEPVRRPARVALMLTLAHRLHKAIEQGLYTNRAELASALGVTRARISQLLDLLLLAPDIQEELLFLEAIDGAEPLSERALRDIVRTGSAWAAQRRAWQSCKRSVVLAPDVEHRIR